MNHAQLFPTVRRTIKLFYLYQSTMSWCGDGFMPCGWWMFF